MNTIITIGRQYGSAGHTIGRMLAEQLGIPFYDKELLELAAKDSGICKELFEHQDEKPTNSFLYSLVMDTYSFGFNPTAVEMPLNQRVFLAQFDAIKKIADEGPCVIVGRCADYALEDRDNVLNIFIQADMEQKVKLISTASRVTEAKAKEIILKNDKQKASYYNYYTSKRWGEAGGYDLCINSSIFGLQGSVNLIKAAIAAKEDPNDTSITDFQKISKAEHL